MNAYDDKTLVAYVDGELDPREAWLVQVALDRDAGLRDKVRVMRETATVLRAAYAPVAREGLPDELERLLAQAGAVVLPFRRRARDAALRWVPRAAAAVLALAISGTGGYWIGRDRSAVPDDRLALQTGSTAAGGVLQAALEKKVSGSELTWTDDRSLASVTVEPIRTYRNEDATFCREYRETVAEPRRTEQTVYGLACRDGGGRWNVQYYLVPGENRAPIVSN